MVFRQESGQQNLMLDVLAKALEFAYIGIMAKQTSNRRQIAISWCFPPPTWFKLNSDGFSLGNPGKAGGGGLIRNDRGEWLKGYARNVGYSTIVAVELSSLHSSQASCCDHRIGC